MGKDPKRSDYYLGEGLCIDQVDRDIDLYMIYLPVVVLPHSATELFENLIHN